MNEIVQCSYDQLWSLILFCSAFTLRVVLQYRYAHLYKILIKPFLSSCSAMSGLVCPPLPSLVNDDLTCLLTTVPNVCPPFPHRKYAEQTTRGPVFGSTRAGHGWDAKSY
jgi:hypothetical protein